MDSPNYVTMHFDLTDEEGLRAFEYARLGRDSHLALWRMWNETCKPAHDNQITKLWRIRLLEIMEDLNVPLEVG